MDLLPVIEKSTFSGASNSERVKPPEGGGADRQTCQRQGCKAPYAPYELVWSTKTVGVDEDNVT